MADGTPGRLHKDSQTNPGTASFDVVSWLDSTFISINTWEKHLDPLKSVFTRLLAANLSVNFTKCIQVA